MQKIKELYDKYREIIVYLIVGVLTTIVSWGCKFLANLIFFDNTMFPTPTQNFILSTVNWVSGVIFAFFTNRAFVFKSHEPMGPEAVKFVLSRVSTWFLDYVVMLILTKMEINMYVATIISSVFVVIANYVLSKIFVFTKKHGDK